MMLPTSNPESADRIRKPLVVGVLGANVETLEKLATICPTNCSLLDINDGLATESVLASCDAVLGVLDGDFGLSSEFISCWNIAKDNDLPRLILAINTVQGRADFDEALALAELVLNEDIAIRYFPIVDDEQAKYIGLLDVLSQEIILPDGTIQPADQEHVALTSDDHNELIDQLLHSDLENDLITKHKDGSPISFPKLRQLWLQSHLVTVLPIDQWVSSTQIESWLESLAPVWVPDVFENGHGKELAQCHDTLGIGIALGVARIWPGENDELLEVLTTGDQKIDLDVMPKNSIFFDSRIRADDVIRPKHSNYLVTRPRI